MSILHITAPVILASASPRRRDLLKTILPNFTVAIPHVDETPQNLEAPTDCAERLAALKAEAIPTTAALIIAADTIVVQNNQLLGKPTDTDHAHAMLQSLSGTSHQVITGVCILQQQKRALFSVTTEVTFRPISAAEIAAYIQTGDPMDKAGAYAIQGGAAHMVEKINGSYTNVVGLPLCELYKRLVSF
jgi:septum formation protein